MMTTFEVYRGNIKVGMGFAVWHEGTLGQPVLIANEGGELAPDWYQMLAIKQELVVVNETIQ